MLFVKHDMHSISLTFIVKYMCFNDVIIYESEIIVEGDIIHKTQDSLL